ncbi:hypothetical protein [Streptomyces sp. NPDC007088]|uniref:hypothetical protein n=1 Tax=Streptomyces sp. NPDC007088 TaxID=3364773 RepID=UPI0036C27034
MTDPHPLPHETSLPYAEEDCGTVSAVFTRSEEDGVAVVSGRCPRCQGRTRSERPLRTPGTGAKGLRSLFLGGRGPDEEVSEATLLAQTYLCACGYPHFGLPAGGLGDETGCGAEWRIGVLRTQGQSAP